MHSPARSASGEAAAPCAQQSQSYLHLTVVCKARPPAPPGLRCRAGHAPSRTRTARLFTPGGDGPGHDALSGAEPGRGAWTQQVEVLSVCVCVWGGAAGHG